MKITVNGEAKTFEAASLTITELLAKSDVENPQLVTVQHNGEFVDEQTYATEKVADGDEVEFLYFLGGGQ